MRKAREDFGGRGEEGVEAEGEIVGFVARRGREEVAGDLEGDGADCDVDWGGEELGGQAGHYRTKVSDKQIDDSFPFLGTYG